MNTKAKGIEGETIACEYLEKNGYTILERNFASKLGEIDIICLDNGQVVFVEVKRRLNGKYGNGLESITPQKIRCIVKTAEFYLVKNRNYGADCRFDAILVDDEKVVEHIKSAFTKNDAAKYRRR